MESATPWIQRSAELIRTAENILTIRGLRVCFARNNTSTDVIRGVDLAVSLGECLGVVGESGAGKTQMFLAALGLLPPSAHISGSVCFRDQELVGLSEAEMSRIRGARMAMVFQDPTSSLTPHLRIGYQLREVLRAHRGLSNRESRNAALAMLERVGISDPTRRLAQYPHELSGGMRQRVMIAMALLCDPDVIIADEPTTALDVTVQAEILGLIRDVIRNERTAVILISHDFSVITGLCDRVAVMYAGRIVEQGRVDEVFTRPSHPYTDGLLRAAPRLGDNPDLELAELPGQAPTVQHDHGGCAFEERCAFRFPRCSAESPRLERVPGEGDHLKACHLDQFTPEHRHG